MWKGGNISHMVTGGFMAFHGLKHWCGTENSPSASTSRTSAASPFCWSVKGGDYTCRTVSNFTSTAASRWLILQTEINGKTRKYKSECLMPIHLRFIKWERLLHHKWFGNFRITHKCAKVVHIWTFNPTTVAQSYIKVHTISKLREHMVLGCLAMPQSDATSPSTLLLSEFGLSPYAVSFYLLMH